MKHSISLTITLLFWVGIAQGQTSKTVGGAGANYATLKLAFDAINAGTINGAITLQITGSTTETASAVLNASGSGSASYTSVNIYPTNTGYTIGGNIAGTVLNLNGADNVAIDGRVNASGSAIDLIITNTNTSTSSATIRFLNSAENNTVKYCTIKGSETNGSNAVIFFSTSISGNGNNGNTIDRNNITSNAEGRPLNAVFSYGTAGHENSGNTISNNNIYNFLNVGVSSNGIQLGGFTNNWTVSGNSFFETTIPFVPTGAFTYQIIRVTSSTNHLISGNCIGGSAPLCGGSPFTVNSNTAHYFCGIYITGSPSIPCIVENNIIQNINYTSVEDNPWDGIFINSGVVNVTGNTIGATTGTGSITITTPLPSATATISGGVVTAITLIGGGNGYTTAPLITFSVSGSTTPATATANLTGGVVTSITLNSGGIGYTSAPSVIFDGQLNGYSTSHGMIQNSNGTVTISDNNIGSITTVGSNYYSHGCESVYVRSVTGTTTFSNNLIGSRTTPNSIYTSSSAALSPQKQDIYGIYSSSIGTIIMSGNIIANLCNAYSGTNTGTRTRGIVTTGGSNTITNNTVRNISTSSAQSGTASNASLVGISQIATTAGTTQTISGNTIYDLFNTNATARVDVYGMYYAGPTTGSHEVSGNFIHSLSISSTNVGSSIDGIAMNSGNLVTCANNIINLGGTTLGYQINGIWDGTVAGNTVNLYFNTIYIGGSVSSGITSSTAALNNANNTSTRNYRNNILDNARSGGSTGKHYAIVLAGVAGLTIDYNDYYFAGTVLGKISTLEKADLTAWKLGTSQDVNSLAINPGFTTPGGTSAVNYYTSAVMPGISGTGITTDYAGLTRGATPKIGALEANNYTWQGSTSTDFATAGNWTSGAVPPDGADIIFAANPDRNCVLDQNRTVGNITNAQSTDKLVVNGKQLTINGNLIFSNGAQIDATATSSVVVFAGTSAQSIPSGAFVSNIIDGLTINNANGLALNNDLTIPQTLTLTSGAFAIGANTLTLNGAITTTSGTLTGGSSTNISIGGSGASTSLPAVSLNNLTLNRANGITLGGSVSIGGTLALTNGILTVGANTLTISGSSLTRTTGSIDAGNAGATLTFTNAAAITLPASIFTGNVNNLTINGAGGITANSDFTTNGVLNLQSANPSAIKGSLDLGTNTLIMGANATTTGIGDVTGIVKRSSFVASTDYSFGNQFTTMTIAAGGTMPADISFKIGIGTAPSWKGTAVQRTYDIIRTGGSGTTVTLSLHYLDSELQSNIESNLVIWDYHPNDIPPIVEEHGKANQSITENWVAISNRSITYFGTAFDDHPWGLSNKESADFTWQGTPSTDWNDQNNWSGGVIPGLTSSVVIPDASTTLHDPVLPSSPSALVKTITIQSGGILDGGATTTMTVAGSTGAWLNLGTFNAGTSTVIFTHANATMADPTNFYNVTIANGAGLTAQSGNIMRIAGTLALEGTGVLKAALLPNTIEFNGTDQIIINPNGPTPGYYNLILSGSGSKSLPATALSVAGDFTTSGTVTATAGAAITVGGELTIESGSTFITGNFTHAIGGNFDNSGVFTASAGNTISMNGASAQSVYGTATTTFDKLTIDNSNGVILLANENINNLLTLTSGNLSVGATTLGINGTISKTSGYIEVSPLSSLSFGGTGAFTSPDNLFTATPSVNNLTINRSGGVMLGNQNVMVNGLLELSSGTFNLGANTLTLSGSSPVRTSGTIDASNSSATLTFTNTTAITLPVSIFSGDVNNLTINATGGVTSSSDFTVNGLLHLQSENPSSTKGSLDMWDGSAMKTLTMGASATTTGIGDVTGIVTRGSIVSGVTYTFGNEFTTAYFPTEGTMPTQMSAKITIGTVPSWSSGAIAREIQVIQTGGSGTKAVFSIHYLDSELNGNDEGHLVLWVGPTPNLEYGRSAYNSTDNWIALSNINVGNYFTSTWDANKNITLDEYSTTSTLTWNGSVSDSWTSIENWTPNAGPSSDKNIIIPDASTTLNSPTLPSVTEIKTLTIDAAGILNSASSAQLTINGGSSAWNNVGGTFNAGTSTVKFSNASATINGYTSFFNLSLLNGSGLTMTTNSSTQISGTLTNDGTLNAAIFDNNIEYNGGSQAIVNPNGLTPGYHNLFLSGSGTKTMPASSLSIYGDMTIAATFSANGGTVVMNGPDEQTISGTTALTFNHLSISNVYGAVFNVNTNVNGNLTVVDGSMIINPAKNLTVNGTTTLGSGESLVLKSNASGSASFIDNGISGSGTATVQRYLTNSGSESEWHMVSSPITAGQSGIFLTEYLMQYNEPLYKYEFIIPTDILLDPMKGFAVWVNNTSTKLFTGSLNTGNQNINVTRTWNAGSSDYNGWNLLGNPYPSGLDASQLAYTGAESATWFWDLSGSGNYKVWVSGGGGTHSQYIPPMQGFFVHCNSGTNPSPQQNSGSVGFTNAARTHTLSEPFWKEAELIPDLLRIKATGTVNQYSDELSIYFNPERNGYYEPGYDALKFHGNADAPQIYTKIRDTMVTVNALSFTEMNFTVPMGFYVSIPGDYLLNASEAGSFPDNISINLEDLKLNTTQNLRMYPEYSFTYDTIDNPDRFLLHFYNPSFKVNELNNSGAVQIYSYNDCIYIQSKDGEPLKGEVYIYDILGKEMMKVKVNSDRIITLRPSVSKGNYIVKMISTNGVFTRKVNL